MVKWEYTVVAAKQNDPADENLARYGLEGWEAVNIIGFPDMGTYWVLMKRRVDEGEMYFPDPKLWPRVPGEPSA